MEARSSKKCDSYCTLIILFIIALLCFVSCKTPGILLDPGFKEHADVYDVKGRNGLQIKQKLSFGPYQTGYVSRGWIRSYDLPFIVRFSGASEKLSFSIGDSINKATVYCLGKVKRQELELIRSYFGIVLKEEDAFAGNISFDENRNWDFVVYNASNTNVLKDTHGFMRSPAGQITIRALREMEGKNTVLSRLGIYGYEFLENGKKLAAVDLMNKGRIFLSPDLNQEKKLLLSAMCSALLLRTNLDAQAG